MDRKLLRGIKYSLVCFGLLVAGLIDSFGQEFSYSSGALSIKITVFNVCPLGASPPNGSIRFDVISTAGPAAQLVIIGPPTLFPAQSIPAGTSYTFNPGQTLPAGNYDWIIGDQTSTIGSLATPALPRLVITNITSPSITKDIEQNNSSCVTPTGQIQASINGGSKTIGTGSYEYKWTADNGSIPVTGLIDTVDGVSPLHLATLLSVSGLRGGQYDLTIRDLYSHCSATATFTITDPSPAVQTITTPTPLNVCAGDNVTITLNNSESGVTYEILRNGSPLPTSISALGDGTSPFSITFPHTQFSSGDNILVRATNGFCTTVLMTGNVNLIINPIPTVSSVNVAPVCEGSASTTLTYGSTTGSPSQYSIDYDLAAEAQGFVDVVNVPLTASPLTLVVPPGAVPGSYNASFRVKNTTTNCPSTATPINVTIIANPTITLGANPSVCIGATTASLTYSATSGSPNQYSIDFDVTAQGQGFVDVTNAALPASPISITIPGGAVVGTYNATLTIRNNVTGCTSSPSQPITVTINANPTITLGASPTICSGLTAANLPYGAITGSPDLYSIDFDATAEAQGFLDVNNSTLLASPIGVVVPAGAIPQAYNATIIVRNSVTGCASSPQAFTVTVIASPTITLGLNPAVCLGASTASLPYTATTGTPNQYNIDFDAAAEGVGFVDVSGASLTASPISILIPVGATAGVYNATITVTNTTTTCSSTPPQAITITINPNPTITLDTNPSICTGTLVANLGYTATTGSPNQYSINFNAAAEAQGFVDVVNATLPATPIVIAVPAGAVAGTYNGTLTVRNSTSGCVSPISSPISVTISPTPTLTLGANPSVCFGSLTAPLVYTGTTGSPDQYAIDFNLAAEAQGFVDVPATALAASPIILNVPVGAVAGTYNAMITVLNTTTGCPSAPQAITVTIIANPTITLGANPSVCIGSLTASLGYTATTGAPNQYSIDFDGVAEGQGFTDVSGIVLPATPISITIPGAAIAGTYNATITVQNTTTTCSSAPPQAFTVTINPNPTITLGANPIVCRGTVAANLGYTGVTGSPNQYSINFNPAAEAQGFVDVVNAALPATPIVIAVPAGAVAGTYNGTLTVRNGASGCVSPTATPVSVTINPTPTITLGANPSVCIGATTYGLGYTATTGSPNQYLIDYNALAEAQGFTDVTVTALPATPITLPIPGTAVAGTYNATITVVNTTTTCPSAPQAFTVTIVNNPTITLGASPSVCFGSTTAGLPYTATTGSPNEYSIDFDLTAQGQGFADVASAALTASPINLVVPGGAIPGTYNGTITVQNTTTGCGSTTQPFTVTINPNPTITLGANPIVCRGTVAANLGYTGVTGSPDQYSINFNPAAEAQGFVDVVNAALPATPIVIAVPAGAVAGTYNGTLTVRNGASGCVSPTATPVSVTINPTPTITLGANPSVCIGATTYGLGYTATTGSPNQYLIDYNALAEAQGFTDVTVTALPATPITLPIPGTAVAGTYNATITVVNTTTTCPSAPQAFTVTLVNNPTITLGASPSVCVGSTTAGLPYTATTGSPNEYSIDFDLTAQGQGFADVASVALTASPINLVVPGGAIPGTYNGTITVQNTTTGCGSTTQPFTVTINPNPTITLDVNPSICSGTLTADLGYTATTGTPDQYSINFNAAAEAQGFVDVVNAILPVTPIVIAVPAGAVAGTYNGTLTVRNSVSGCVSAAATPMSVTISPTPTITLGANPSVCIGSANASLTYSATTGAPNQYSIDFDATAEAQGFVDITPTALPASPITITIPGAAVAGTYNATISVINSALSCTSTTQAITVTINPNPTITLGTNPSVCRGTTTADLGYTATTGTPNQYSINFDLAAEAQGFVDVVNATLTATPIVITVPAGAIAGTYNGLLSVRNNISGCFSADEAITVTIDAIPTITLGTNPTICQGATSAGLIYTAVTGAPDEYSIDFNAAAEAQGFVDIVNAILPVTPIPIAVSATAAAGTYSGTLTVRRAASGCVSASAPISITIVARPTATISTTTPDICNGTNGSISIAFTGTGPWTFTYSTNGGPPSAPASWPFPNLIIPVGPTSNTVYTIVSVTDSNPTACPGIGIGSATINVNNPPDASLTVDPGLDPLCAGGISSVIVRGSESNVSYQLRIGTTNVGTAVTGTGSDISISTGVLNATTTFNVFATAPGCSPGVQLTDQATINVAGAVNASFTVTPQDVTVCSGSTTTINISGSENGVLYQLQVGGVAASAQVPGTGSAISIPTAALTANTVFTVLASNGTCSILLTDDATVNVGTSPDITLAVDAAPNPLCVGGIATVTITAPQAGVTYQLRNDADDTAVGTSATGSGPTLDLLTGALAANIDLYVEATSTGCPAARLTDMVTITVSGNVDATLPVSPTDPEICSGNSTTIEIETSEAGVDYRLRTGGVPFGPIVTGTGGTITITTGPLTATTTFDVLADNGTCSIILTQTATVTVDPAPNATLALTASLNPLCTGGSTFIRVVGAQTGVSYQLKLMDNTPVNGPVVGAGSDVFLSTGVLNATTQFKVEATSGVCPAVDLTATVTITVAGAINAGLTTDVTGTGTICSGSSAFVRVLASETGVNYQLRNKATDVATSGLVAGNNGTILLTTGSLAATTTFYVVASNGTCSIALTDEETITVNPAPATNLTVTAVPALICSGNSSLIRVANSQNGVSYHLRVGATDLPGIVAGNNGTIDLPTGALTITTTFTVVADGGAGCTALLTTTPTVTIRPVGDPACGAGPSDCANFSAIVPTITTQPSCNDRDAGVVTFTISRADATATTFRVIWTFDGVSQTKFTSNTVAFNDLSSGQYQYTIIDEGNGKSCGPVDFFLDLQTQVKILSKTVTNTVTCFGGTDGNVILSATGSSTGEYWYKYVLDGVESGGQTFTPGAPLPGGLPADDTDFIILKVDESFAFSCPDTVRVRIKHAFPKINFVLAATDVTTCNGTNGGIQVTAIGGGDSGANPLQIRLKKAVPFSQDPSGYAVVFDFEDVVSGAKDYPQLGQGNYVVDVKDHLDCIQSKPIAVQAPGQVPLSSVSIVATDASCVNEGKSGSVKVTISDPGSYQVAISQDQLNTPADDQFITYNAPTLPNITFNNLSRGAYYLYFKSATTTCPTRTDAIVIDGVQAISRFEVLSSCNNVNLTLNNITGQTDAPFVIRVFDNDDKFFKIDSLTATGIPLSNSVSFIYVAPLQHSFLINPGTYRFVMIQTQTSGAGTCTLVSDTVVYDVRQGLGIVMGTITPSFPEPKRTGSILIENVDGGTRFESANNELYYEISLTTADDDIVIFDWTEVKLNPQNKFSKLYEYLPPGVYRVKVRDASGCVKTQDVEIPFDSSIYIPNIFTPNDDEVNDEFEVLNLPVTGTHKLIISNRWGNEVFKSNDYRAGNFWNANEIADGIYFYRLKVDGGETYTGWVEILRGSKP